MTETNKEVVRFEARIHTPSASFPTAKTFDCFDSAANFVLTLYQNEKGRATDAGMKRMQDSISISKKVYKDYDAFKTGRPMSEHLIWSGMDKNLPSLVTMRKIFQMEEERALTKGTLFVSGDGGQDSLRKFLIIKDITETDIKAELHYNATKNTKLYPRESFLKLFHKGDGLAVWQYEKEKAYYSARQTVNSR